MPALGKIPLGRGGSVALAVLTLALAGCGSSARLASGGAATSAALQAHPQAIEPTAGQQATTAVNGGAPVGDPNAHAPSLSAIRRELKLELVAASRNNATYIDPLQYVTIWERTDQGVDAVMPVGAPILAPCRIKILAVEPNWYLTQPLVYWELLDGPDAGRVQYVAEEITSIARPGSILQQGQAIARFAKSGTGIEFGWSTPSGITLAQATTGYGEGQPTPAGKDIRAWLNALGAHAGPG